MSAAKDLASLPKRSFAALRMTARRLKYLVSILMQHNCSATCLVRRNPENRARLLLVDIGYLVFIEIATCCRQILYGQRHAAQALAELLQIAGKRVWFS